jgi:hypothetical protein
VGYPGVMLIAVILWLIQSVSNPSLRFFICSIDCFIAR